MEHMPKGTKMPEDVDEMMRFSQTMFYTATEQAMKEGYTRFIVILDALNQMDDDGNASHENPYNISSSTHIQSFHCIK